MNNCLKIERLESVVSCKSSRGEYATGCNEFSHEFTNGVYILKGDIDSGGWTLSYIISSYKTIKNQIIFHKEPNIILNSRRITIKELCESTCYIDKTDDNKLSHLFKIPIKSIIEKNLKSNKLNYSSEDIRNLFCIDKQRYERNINYVGNEFYRCKAAVEFTKQKTVYCFPWFSSKLMRYYEANILRLCDILASLDKIVLLPTSYTLEYSSAKVINFD